ncbi:MAG: 50S ribosomal protein L25/general stress protein Ctc [Gammaproteobacteria bacterium]|nr:50S ribosomal protein L25/general stress protein Ctc [Gammaproteobacteria bacterium]
MSEIDFSLSAEPRKETGTSAMRKMRRAGQLPGVVYGAGGDAVPITLSGLEVSRHLEHEAFYSHVLNLKLKGKREGEQVILRSVQRHPVRSDVLLHIDLQRISKDAKIKMTIPLHFKGEDIAPGVKEQSGLISHLMTEVEVSCLPSDLPEFIEVDISGLHIGELVHLSDLAIPEGLELVELSHGHDHAVATIHVRREEIEEEEVAVEEPEGEEGEEAEEQAAEAEEKDADSAEEES